MTHLVLELASSRSQTFIHLSPDYLDVNFWKFYESNQSSNFPRNWM